MSDRQEEIVLTALRLISDYGIQELTMKKIAGAIGITEPALYRHYTSKLEILSAVVDTMAAARFSILKDSPEGGQGADAVIAAFFLGHARLFAGEPSMTVILFSEDLFRSYRTLSDRIAAMISDAMRHLETELRQGVEAHAFRDDLDAATASLLLVGGFRQLVSSWRLSGYGFSLEERTEAFLASTLRLFAGT